MRRAEAALLIDFYELTMGHAYFQLGMNDTATFELFVRSLPRSRRFLVAAGLEQALEYLEQLRFSSEELDFLAGLGTFDKPFLDHLAQLRFTGEVHAMAEGTACYANEPILRITAPILEGQLVESRMLNIFHFQTLIASKAARCVWQRRGGNWSISGCAARMKPTRDCTRPGRPTLPAFTRQRRSKRASGSALRSQARWHIRSSKRTSAKTWRFGIS